MVANDDLEQSFDLIDLSPSQIRCVLPKAVSWCRILSVPGWMTNSSVPGILLMIVMGRWWDINYIRCQARWNRTSIGECLGSAPGKKSWVWKQAIEVLLCMVHSGAPQVDTDASIKT